MNPDLPASSSMPSETTQQRLVANALPAGYRLLEYSFDSVLGYGGFGITYLATDHNLDCKVAIKEYLPSDQTVRAEGYALQPRSVEAIEVFQWGLSRFLDEARALATFNHPHIVRVLRFFEANNTAYMVMELVLGQSLSDWTKRHRPMDEATLLAVIRPLLDGLTVIHAAGFVHRDVKPGNIHMRSDRHPVLLDFGAARKLATTTDRDLTAIVTPGYAALEQYHSQGNQGPWSDIYSMAAVMYGMITGHRPIEAPARIRKDRLPRALEVGDRALYSEQLLRAVDWALTPDEEKRPQSVQAFIQTLPAAPSMSEGSNSQALAPSADPGSGPVSAPVAFDAAVIAKFEAALASHLGPMAGVMVRRRAKSHSSIAALRTALAEDIDSERSRRMFLERTEGLSDQEPSSRTSNTIGAPADPSQPASAPPTTLPSRFDPSFLAAVETELAHHLGPLSRVLVKKSAEKARDRAELFLLLSDHIADPAQRRAFIRKSVAAFKKGKG